MNDMKCPECNAPVKQAGTHLDLSPRIDYVPPAAPRVPLKSPTFAADDVQASATMTPRYARRFSLDVAEDALAKLAPAVLPWVVERLAGQIAQRHQGDVEIAVNEYLRNREWAEPVIREAIRDAVQVVVRDMLNSSPLGDTLRHEQF